MSDSPPPEFTPEMLQQQPALLVALLLVFGLMVLLISGGIGSWIYFGMRALKGLPLLTVEPWRPRVWGLLDMVLIVVAIFLGQWLLMFIGVRLLGIDVQALRAADAELPLSLAMVASLGNLAALALGALWIRSRFGVPFSHLGFSARKLPRHLTIGSLVGLATLPLIYLLMMAVSLGMDAEYEHPLIKTMIEQGSVSAYLMGVVTAALVAPLAEEFLFRVIIQGWLQSIPFKSLVANVLGGFPRQRIPPRVTDVGLAFSQEFPAGAATPDQALSTEEAALAANPYAAPFAPDRSNHSARAATEAATAYHDDEQSSSAVPPIWPSLVTGTLFGLAHWGYGLSFLPLIVLGIVLGLVYRATHSIWPCVLIHFMLNGMSMAMLGVALLQHSAAS